MCWCRIIYLLRAVIIERRQAVVRPGVEAHHLRLVCVHCQRFPVGINFEPVQHGLQLVMDIGQQREVVSKQQFWDIKVRPVSLQPDCQYHSSRWKKAWGKGDSLASHRTLAAHLLACPHPAVCTHLCKL